MNPLDTRPRSVALIGLGPSLREYLHDSFRKKNVFHVDEVWGINTAHRPLKVDKIWTMDDLHGTLSHNYSDWANELRLETKPIITCKQYDDFPTSVAYPIDAVQDYYKSDFFNTTIAYALAYAGFIGVETLYIYGIDFYYPNAQMVESGLGGASYWLGRIEEKGVRYKIPASSTLLDAHMTQFDEKDGRHVARRMRYGYDYNPQDAKRKVQMGSEDPALIAAAGKAYKTDNPKDEVLPK